MYLLTKISKLSSIKFQLPACKLHKSAAHKTNALLNEKFISGALFYAHSFSDTGKKRVEVLQLLTLVLIIMV